ncbi:MAG: hypothetical protein QY323_01030 [Patescibacteria group bacterium]|nr:MAG: hypothetical protein QY323_01030 [Patescibacteria group bacterium]
MTKSIHIVGKFASEDAALLSRTIKSKYQGAFEIVPHADQNAFTNAVRPDQMPSVLVLGNRLSAMMAGDFAAKLRREGYKGKIFVYTGGIEVAKTQDVDAVFYKPGDANKIVNVLILALHAAR